MIWLILGMIVFVAGTAVTTMLPRWLWFYPFSRSENIFHCVLNCSAVFLLTLILTTMLISIPYNQSKSVNGQNCPTIERFKP